MVTHSPAPPSSAHFASPASAAALIAVGVPGSTPRGDPGQLGGLNPRESLRGDPHPAGSICQEEARDERKLSGEATTPFVFKADTKK